ncbi:MAG: YkgJ family cysteine cluster protein [Candidatus Heimdallarchaeota archaeon]|nr:MAG: YkgJ family cysteine cluster protein [Candidatus Heimdallarchaeota archaeon]
MIRGFSNRTGYNCFECHFKCCSSEYDLPLFPHEVKNLRQNHPFVFLFLKSTTNGEKLTRGDSCPFLRSNGECILHATPEKPLVCQTYPLIFWRIKPGLLLSWIHPCRGNGFRWITEPKHQITEHVLNSLGHKVQNYFKNYWGEQVDRNSPYTDISYDRIIEESRFFSNNSSLDLITKMIKLVDSDSSLSFIYTLRVDLNSKSEQRELLDVINAVLHWLSWSPVGLQLTFINSKLILLVAAMWIEFTVSSSLFQLPTNLNRERYLQQIGSFLSTAILPSFWSQIEIQTHSDPVRNFSRCVRKILSGKIPQQKLSTFSEI